MAALQVQGFRLFPALSFALIIPRIDGFVLWDLDLAIIQLTLYNAFYQVMMPQYGADPAECYEARFYSYGLLAFWTNGSSGALMKRRSRLQHYSER